MTSSDTPAAGRRWGAVSAALVITCFGIGASKTLSTPSELPDFLPVVLEFGSVGDLAVALEQLARHRAGLELLERALHQFESPYADVVTALLPVVPPAPAGPTAEELAFSGPPAEQVGLAPFVPLESLKVGARS